MMNRKNVYFVPAEPSEICKRTVHEIIEKPTFFKKAFIKLLSLSSTETIIFNSIATQKFWSVNSQIRNKRNWLDSKSICDR